MLRSLSFEPLEARQLLAPVVAVAETTSAAGAADDIAIWIHPSDPGQSRVIGAIKSGSSSMEVYRLDGARVQTVTAGDINNIDLRYNFPTSAGRITLLSGSDRSSDSLALYKIDSAGQLSNVALRTISTGIDVYGCTMYVSPTSGKYYAFVSSESGELQQWELVDAGGGRVDAVQVRAFDVGRTTEGLVVDDGTGYLYVAEEDVGIWRYSAEPDGGTARTRVDSAGSSGHLTADVEGLALFYRADGKGYLIASSQGSDDFVVYQRDGTNGYVGRFNIVAGSAIDAVSDTDGIDVTNFDLGDGFSGGMFVAQDNDVNFKLVSWEAIAMALGGLVEVDTTWDPRDVGAPDVPPSSKGDFNKDGSVDAADYLVWRDHLGQSVPAFTAADGDGDGNIGAHDYSIWKSNYGSVVGAGVVRTIQADSWRRGSLEISWLVRREAFSTADHEAAWAENAAAASRAHDLHPALLSKAASASAEREDGTQSQDRRAEARLLPDDVVWEEWLNEGDSLRLYSVTKASLAASVESTPKSGSP